MTVLSRQLATIFSTMLTVEKPIEIMRDEFHISPTGSLNVTAGIINSIHTGINKSYTRSRAFHNPSSYLLKKMLPH